MSIEISKREQLFIKELSAILGILNDNSPSDSVHKTERFRKQFGLIRRTMTDRTIVEPVGKYLFFNKEAILQKNLAVLLDPDNEKTTLANVFGIEEDMSIITDISECIRAAQKKMDTATIGIVFAKLEFLLKAYAGVNKYYLENPQ